MFPITMTIHNPAQLNAVMAALNLAAAAPAEPTTAELVQIAKDRADAHAATWPHTIEEVTANQEARAAAQRGETATAAPGKSAKASPAPTKPTAAAAVADAPAKTADDSSPAAASAAAKQPASTAAEPITYDKVAAAITAMVKVNREHAVDTLTKFGVRKGPELKPEQYVAFLAALNQPEEVPA